MWKEELLREAINDEPPSPSKTVYEAAKAALRDSGVTSWGEDAQAVKITDFKLDIPGTTFSTDYGYGSHGQMYGMTRTSTGTITFDLTDFKVTQHGDGSVSLTTTSNSGVVEDRVVSCPDCGCITFREEKQVMLRAGKKIDKSNPWQHTWIGWGYFCTECKTRLLPVRVPKDEGFPGEYFTPEAVEKKDAE